MDTVRCQKLLQKYAPAMAYISSRDKEDNCGIGSAFHVGEGVFITARHVVENRTIDEIKATEFLRIDIKDEFPSYPQEAIDKISEISGSPPTWPIIQESLIITDGPFFHSDDSIDIAVFRVKEVHPKLPTVLLGTHLDDWIHRYEWRLSEALILGFPPIPFTTSPLLFTARAEINAVAWPRTQSHPNFILSAMPRGGFSGGLVLHENDFALGIVTQSLIQDGQPSELGYLTVLSIEPIYECLAQKKLLPECQKEGWNDFWNTETADFIKDDGLLVASVSAHDDGKRIYFDIRAGEPEILRIGIKAGVDSLKEINYEKEEVRADWIRFHLKLPPNEASQHLQVSARAVELAIATTGLKQVRTFSSDTDREP